MSFYHDVRFLDLNLSRIRAEASPCRMFVHGELQMHLIFYASLRFSRKAAQNAE